MKRFRIRDLEHVNLLTLSPVRVAEWEEVGDRVVVLRPKPRTRGLRGALDRLFHALSARRIRLDDTGSFVWRRLDGEHTVADIIERLRETFGDAVEPAEERLGQLIWVLRREELLAYPGFDDEATGG